VTETEKVEKEVIKWQYIKLYFILLLRLAAYVFFQLF